MSAFDEARSEGPARTARSGAGGRTAGGGGAGASTTIEVASVDGYQASDSGAICTALETDLRNLAGVVATVRRAIDTGGAGSAL